MKRKRAAKELDMSIYLLELFMSLKSDDKKKKEYDNVEYEYIELVYPPDSKPPTRKSFKNMNLIDFSKIGI